ncbi:MAG: carotenoid biosynthesis protein [Chloroflexota bacterium]
MESANSSPAGRMEEAAIHEIARGGARGSRRLQPSLDFRRRLSALLKTVQWKWVITTSLVVYIICLATARVIQVFGLPVVPEFLIPYATVLFFAFSLGHAILQLGAFRAVVMLVSTLTITLGAELLGASTGAIFGPYHYTDAWPVKVLGLVPPVLPLAWFMMLYCSVRMAEVLGSGWTGCLERRSVLGAGLQMIALSTIGALAMVAWDLGLDPVMVRLGFWEWEESGVYFGIPLSNYTGWFLTALAVQVVYRITSTLPVAHSYGVGGGLSHLPLVAYAVTGLDAVVLAVILGMGGVAISTFLGMGAFVAATIVVTRAQFRRGQGRHEFQGGG